jgi:thiamine pyrophosphokinase
MSSSHPAPRTSHVVIFANGDLPDLPLPLPDHDLLIAADGGAAHALRFGLVPDEVIGDLDSVSEADVARVEAAGGTVHRFPMDKDETDLELALNHASACGAARITCFGLTGGRWDMTVANFLLLAGSRYAGIDLLAVAGDTRIHVLRGGERLPIVGRAGDTVSVLPVNGPAIGLTYEGLSWPLHNADLPFGSPRGVSNTMEAERATISLREGVVLVFVAPGTR